MARPLITVARNSDALIVDRAGDPLVVGRPNDAVVVAGEQPGAPPPPVAELLLDLDWRSPAQTVKASTAASVASALGVSAGDVAEAWRCDEAAGSLVGEISAFTLAQAGAGAAHQRKIVGLYDGTDAYSIPGIELPSATGRFVDGDSSHLDDDGITSFGIFVVFRRWGKDSITNKEIFSKGVGGAFYSLRLATSGAMIFVASDGVVTDGGSTTQRYNNGSIHFAWFVVDRAASAIRLITDLETVVDAGATVGSMSNGTGFTLGSGGSAPVQIPYVAAVVGASAEGVTQADCRSLWPHGSQNTDGAAPSQVDLDIYNRASIVAPAVGAEGGFGLRRSKYGLFQFAHKYNAAFAHANKLGAYFSDARTNLLGESGDFGTTWVPTDLSVIKDDVEASDGTFTADRLTATADNGHIDLVTATVAETEYTAWVELERFGGSDVSGRLIIYDETGAVELASQAFTAGADIARVSLTATTNVGQISTSVRVEIDTSGEAVDAWEAGLVLGKLTAAIPTPSAIAARVATVATLNNTGGDTFVKNAAGEIEIVCALDSDVDAARTLVEVSDAATDNDRIHVEVQADGTVRARIWDSTGTLRQTVTAADPGNWDQEHTVRLRWDSVDGVDGNPENADLVVDAVRTAGSATAWTAGTGATKIHTGHNRGAEQANGSIATLKAWEDPRAEVP